MFIRSGEVMLRGRVIITAVDGLRMPPSFFRILSTLVHPGDAAEISSLETSRGTPVMTSLLLVGG